MTEKSKRPSRRSNIATESRRPAAESAQTQSNQPITVSPTTQPATPAQNQALTPDRASREFREISNRLNVVTSLFRAQSLQTPCRGEGRWCLPDVNCTARATFSPTVRDAFVNNQQFCGNEAPVLDLDFNDSSGVTGADFATNFDPMGGPVTIADSDATLTDVENVNLQFLTVTITNLLNGSNEILEANISTTAGITKSYDSATGVLLLNGEDTLVHYLEVLKTITYNNTAAADTNGTLRVIEFVANDGISNSNTAIAYVTIVYPANPIT